MNRLRVEYEGFMPFEGDEINIANLRNLSKELVAKEGCSVQILFHCTTAQLHMASKLPGYIDKCDFTPALKAMRPYDNGACENFNFR